MSLPSSISESRATQSLTSSLTTHPTLNFYNLVRLDFEFSPFELPPALSDRDSSSSPVLQQESQPEHRNEIGKERENENEQPVEPVLFIPHREVLVPGFFNFSFEAAPRQASSSPPCSPLSRPVQPNIEPPNPASTLTSATAPNPSTSTSTSTTSTRSPLNSTIHLTTYVLSSLNTIQHGIPNIQSTYSASSSSSSSSIAILFPHTTSFLKSLNRLASSLTRLLRRLESHSTSTSHSTSSSASTSISTYIRFNRPSRSVPDLPLQQINRILMNLSAAVIEPIFDIFRYWHDCPGYGNDWYHKRKVILDMDLRFEGFENRVGRFEGEIGGLKGLGLGMGIGVGVSWFCEWVRGLVGWEVR